MIPKATNARKCMKVHYTLCTLLHVSATHVAMFGEVHLPYEWTKHVGGVRCVIYTFIHRRALVGVVSYVIAQSTVKDRLKLNFKYMHTKCRGKRFS